MRLIQFDIRTLLASEAAIRLLFALVMFLMAKHFRRARGLRQLAFAFLATAGGIGFFLMRSLFPAKIDVLFSNGLYCVSNLLIYAGICALIHVRPRLTLPVGIALLSTLVLWLHRAADETVLRLAIITITDLLLRSVLMADLLRNLQRGVIVQWITALVGSFMLCDAVRVLATCHYGIPTDVFQYNVTQSAYIAASLITSCGIGAFSLALAAHEVMDSLEHRARRDSLTGAYNRMGIEELLTAEIARSRRTLAPLCLALLDIDNFKLFNDSGGHAMGDDVLRRITACIHSNIRPYDALGRLGGDEFLLLLPGMTVPDADAICRRILKVVTALPSYPVAGCSPTVSMGLTELAPSDSDLEFIARADRALYAAKHLGRNCVQMKLAPDRTDRSFDQVEASREVPLAD